MFFATPLLVVMGLSAKAFDKKIVDDDEDDYAAQMAASITEVDDEEIRARVRADDGTERRVGAEMIMPDEMFDEDGPIEQPKRKKRAKKKRNLGRK